MGKVRVLIGAGVGAAVATLALPTLAQEEAEGGLLLRFGFDERVEADDNLELDPESEGTTVTSTTDLSFGLTDQTRLDLFSVTAGTAVRASNGPDGAETFLDNHRVALGYARDGARARFALDADYQRRRIEFLRPLEDFVDEDGVIDLPDDIEDLEGEGTRSEHEVAARLDLGIDAPLGLTLDARTSGRDYEDVTDPDLVSERRAELGATGRLRFSPVLTGTVELRRAIRERDNLADTRRETDTAEIGLEYAISPVLQVSAALGFSKLDLEEFGVTETSEGSTQRIEVLLERPNGQITATFDSRITEDGTRQRFSIGRSLDLPTGALSAEIGAEGIEWQDFTPTAEVAWRRILPTGAVSATLRRAVRSADELEGEDEDEVTTALSLSYQHQINDISGLDIGLSYAIIEEDAGRTDSGSLSFAYSHALTEDWNLSAGYRHRLLDEPDEARATSNAVFLGLGRSFDFRP